MSPRARTIAAAAPAAWLALAALLIALGVRAYGRLQFATDGFHYFTFLRNVAGGRAWWEGPTFEYLLGNHSYVTMLLLAPLVGLFRSPLVLLGASVGCYVSGAALLFALARSRFADRPALPWLVAFAFLLYPTSFGMVYADVYLFQPDLLAIPLILGMVLAMEARRHGVFLVLVALLVLTKEELVVVGPAVLLWIAVLDRRLGDGSFLAGRRRVYAVAGVYAGAALVSVGVLLCFRSMNHLHFAARGAHVEFLGRAALWRTAIGSVGRLLLPLGPALVVAGAGSRGRGVVIGATVGVFVIGRTIGSMMLYDDAPLVHWTYASIAPTLFATLVLALPHSRLAARPLLVPAALAFSIAASAYLDRHDRTLRIMRGIDLVAIPGRIAELESLRRSLPPPASPGEAIVTEQYDEALFLDRALIDVDVMAVHPTLAGAAAWMVLRKDKAASLPAARTFLEHGQTDRYVLLKNPQSP